jgi:hypothetical protein
MNKMNEILCRRIASTSVTPNTSNIASMVSRPNFRCCCCALALFALAAASLRAQTHKVDAPEKVTRAIGVYEWTGDLAKPNAARLIPVSLFIDSHLEDAGVYLARPVPFALQRGDVYSIERAGQSEGTLDIDFARNVITRHSAEAADIPAGAWYGYGRFMTPQQEAKLAKLKPSAHPSVIVSSLDDDDTPPHFVYRQPPPSGSGSDSKSSGNGSGSGSGTTTAPAADSERPVLSRRDGSGSPSSSSGSSTSTPSPAPDDDPERPTLRHRDPDAQPQQQKKGKPEGYVTPPNTSLNIDPDRPTMRRGVPEGQAATPQLSGLPPDLHQAVAVSDAGNRDVHPFAREWESSREYADTLAGIEQLAQPRVANYLAVNKLTLAADALADKPAAGPTLNTSRAAAQPATTAASSRAKKTAPTPPPSPPPVPLSNEQISGYTLSYGGLPTFVYTAEVAVATGGPVYLTMVVQRLPAGELQVALSSVTDAAHLDRVPWLRPVDVVDPDWSHRASLLFELRAQTTRQFALYRLVSAKAEQTFLTGIIE